MTKPRKSVVKLCDLEPGQYADCFVQLAEKTQKTTRDGKPYFSCRFRDLRRSVTVRVWADGDLYEECQKYWQPGGFFKVRGTFRDHDKYGPELEVEAIRPVEDRDRADGFSELDFIERSRLDPAEMFAELDSLAAREIADEPLRALVRKLLDDHRAMLQLLPGSEKHYYPFAGGWLEHTLNVARSCVLLADRYIQSFPDLKPPLNRDLVVAGAILHDIGRVRDLEPGAPGQPVQRGMNGELFGHLFLAYDLIRAAAREIPDLKAELVDLVVHLVISHLEEPDWGEPRRSCIPEVVILHHADALDRQFEIYARCLAKDTGDGPFTARDPILRCVVLKKRDV